MNVTLEKLVNGEIPFAMVQKQDSERVLLLVGKAIQCGELSQIPRKSGKPMSPRQYDTISMIPFAQIRERGYNARSSAEKILTIAITETDEVLVEALLKDLPCLPVELENDIEFDMTREEYAELIQHVVDDEIGNGEGANFVVPRTSTGKIKNFSLNQSFTIFRSLLTNDYGTYWKFIFYDGETCFVGSTPERHLYVEKNKVKMNPISGTFRKKATYERRELFKQDLLTFLNDPKEINELFMVVDEELKMMSKMCGQGGAIIGPLLKEMSKLIHSEYLLSGESDKDIMELFTDSMFAATVTGSPVENACNIIKKYSAESRRYYGSALLLMGRDENGDDILDSPITIRTAEIAKDGKFYVAVGATLVRDSKPEDEVLETESKSEALINSIVSPETQSSTSPMLAKLANDDDIHETLQFRNQYLSNFWFFKQESRLRSDFDYSKIKITIIHNEDDFVFMQRHIFNSFGMSVDIVHFSEYEFDKDTGTITLVGPGPGNPNETDNPKIKRNLEQVAKILDHKKPAMFICLGHQLLCKSLGLPIDRKAVPHQGVQEKISLFGREERVGFYNTFVPQAVEKNPNYEFSVREGTKEMLAIRGDSFIGYQFHPESILTKNGDSILKESIAYLIGESLHI